MLKLEIHIIESEPDKVSLMMKKVKEKDFDAATQAEKITASEVKMAIQKAIEDLRDKNKKEGK
jgi:hypothetical protein